MKFRDFFVFAGTFFILFSASMVSWAEEGPQGQPAAFLPAASYKFGTVLEGTGITHEYTIQNRGTAPLEIHRVKTD